MPTPTVARILLRVLVLLRHLQAVPGHPVFDNKAQLTPDELVVTREQKGAPWTHQELAGDVHLMYFQGKCFCCIFGSESEWIIIKVESESNNNKVIIGIQLIIVREKRLITDRWAVKIQRMRVKRSRKEESKRVPVALWWKHSQERRDVASSLTSRR